VRRAKAAAGSALFLVVAPGVVAGLIPWALTGWETGAWADRLGALRVVGGVLVAGGVVALLEAFVRFVREGHGTPAPVAPTDRLVVGGAYRYVRNPMYLAVGATIVGQALLLGRPILMAYAASFGVAVVAFVRLVEEPTLSQRYGAQYDAYRRGVPGWWPRRTPWRGEV
jgi:protein-S-isoprenylcysteine O-methyltransferase Ste14